MKIPNAVCAASPFVFAVLLFAAAPRVEDWILAESFFALQLGDSRLPMGLGIVVLPAWWLVSRLLLSALFAAIVTASIASLRRERVAIGAAVFAIGITGSLVFPCSDSLGARELVAHWSPIGIEVRSTTAVVVSVFVPLMIVAVAVRPAHATIRNKSLLAVFSGFAAVGIVWFLTFVAPTLYDLLVNRASPPIHLGTALCTHGRGLELVPQRVYAFPCEEELCAALAMLSYLTVAGVCRQTARWLTAPLGSRSS